MAIAPFVALSMAVASSALTRPFRLAYQIEFCEYPARAPSFASDPAMVIAASISLVMDCDFCFVMFQLMFVVQFNT